MGGGGVLLSLVTWQGADEDGYSFIGIMED